MDGTITFGSNDPSSAVVLDAALLQSILNRLTLLESKFPINSVDLADGAVTSPKLSEKAVTASKLEETYALKDSLSQSVPVGSLMLWKAGSPIPPGWWECNGQGLLEHPTLMSMYGEVLPDLRGLHVGESLTTLIKPDPEPLPLPQGVGIIVPWGGNGILDIFPAGWIECNGQNTDSFPELARVVGSTVPDLRGEFVRGWDNGRGLDPGRVLRSSQAGQTQMYKNNYVGSNSNGVYVDGPFNGAFYSRSVNSASYTMQRVNAVWENNRESRPRNVALKYLIRATSTAIALPAGIVVFGPQTLANTLTPCDGASTAAWPAVETAYGGLGASIPDLRGEFVRGWDDGRGADLEGSNRGLRSLQNSQSELYKSEYIGANSAGSYSNGPFSADYWLRSVNSASYTMRRIDAVWDTERETRPNNVALQYAVVNSDLDFTLVPSGTILLWPLIEQYIPEGWIECNGQATTTYPDLNAAFGETVPDLRGLFVRGWDNTRGVDLGRAFGSYQESQTELYKSEDIGNNQQGFYSGGPFDGQFWVKSTNTASYTHAKTDAVWQSGMETRPRNIALMYIVKT